MEIANTGQMRKIDSDAINNTGIPGIVLMENAAISVVSEIKSTLEKIEYKSIVIFCGKGNNGGDGFAIARHLYNMGANVIIILLADKKDVRGDALTNLSIVEKMGVKIVCVNDGSFLESIAASLYLCDLVVDAIFGTGIKGAIKGINKEIIELINTSGTFVISVDIPSGINGDTGEICDICIKADKTVTFALPKIGLVVYPGAKYVGELIVSDISIPREIIDSQNILINTIDKSMVWDLLPIREKESNKGDYGKILLIVGSKGMTGAGVLSSEAALKTGSGLVTAAVPDSLNSIFEMKLTEVMTLPLKDKNGILVEECMEVLEEKIKTQDILVFGPGLSNTDSIQNIIYNIIKVSTIPIVIDADGINTLARNINILKEKKCPIILTPHPGEMSRLTGYDIEYIQRHRIEISKQFAQKWNVIIVLKGARTIVALPNGHVFINTIGNPGMASAGMGDVLTGIIASLAGQGVPFEYSAVCGVYIHAKAGDYVSLEQGVNGVTAGDVIRYIPYVLKEIGGI